MKQTSSSAETSVSPRRPSRPDNAEALATLAGGGTAEPALSTDPEYVVFTAELTNPTSGETYALECTLRFELNDIDVLFADYWRNIVSRLGMDLDTYDVATEHWLEIEVRRQWLAAQRRGK